MYKNECYCPYFTPGFSIHSYEESYGVDGEEYSEEYDRWFELQGCSYCFVKRPTKGMITVDLIEDSRRRKERLHEGKAYKHCLCSINYKDQNGENAEVDVMLEERKNGEIKLSNFTIENTTRVMREDLELALLQWHGTDVFYFQDIDLTWY